MATAVEILQQPHEYSSSSAKSQTKLKNSIEATTDTEWQPRSQVNVRIAVPDRKGTDHTLATSGEFELVALERVRQAHISFSIAAII